MAKTELKTKKTEASVESFLSEIADKDRREDSRKIVELMTRISGEEPKMWGPTIVGFGQTMLKYDSGRELDWMKIGFSPRKANLTLYGLTVENEKLLERLGKYKTGKGCLYINRFSDIDGKVLEQMISSSLKRKSA